LNTTICSAIRSKQVITFYYDGGERVVEPFCYGISSSGNELLRGFQVGGYSKSGKPFSWKLFRVDEISRISLTNETFQEIRPNYNPNDKGMKTIYCHI